MSDRPDLAELLDAVRMHLEMQVLPVIRGDPRLYFQTLVALNMLKIGERELAHGAEMLHAEWAILNTLTGENSALPAFESDLAQALIRRRTALCSAIRRGEYDSTVDAKRLTAYLQPVISAQLALNNPALDARISREIVENAYAD
jgi:hypothetical protein